MIKISALNKRIKTEVCLSGSKSLSNRYLMLRAISGLNINFKNLSDSDDTITLAKELGVITGQKKAEINVGHAGTDMRFLTAFLAIKEGEWVVTGSERMKQRPIGELVSVLNEMGAQISYLSNEGYPPIRIIGKKIQGGEAEVDGSVSSQFITSLLLIAPILEKGLTLHLKGEVVSKLYIKMTIALLKKFGITVSENNDSIVIPHSKFINGVSEIHVESDWSSASYWYSVAALAQEAEIEITHLSSESLQPDLILPLLFDKLGVHTEFTKTGIKLTKKPIAITQLSYDFVNCPDIAQTIAAVCVGLGIDAHLTGLQTLKVKETDRIEAMKHELEKFGATVVTTHDSVKITPLHKIVKPEGIIETYHDHRMAMSIAPLALLVGELQIKDPDVVNKSYAAFWDDFQEAGFEID